MAKTLRDVHQCLHGLGGVVVQMMPPAERTHFVRTAAMLYEQLLTDYGLVSGTEVELPDETVLSEEADRLLEALQRVKRITLERAMR